MYVQYTCLRHISLLTVYRGAPGNILIPGTILPICASISRIVPEFLILEGLDRWRLHEIVMLYMHQQDRPSEMHLVLFSGGARAG